MEEVKQPFYKKVIASIKDFDRYQEFATQSLSSGIKYFFKLLLILVILISVIDTFKFVQTVNETVNYIKDYSPYFKYEDGKLYVDSVEGFMYEDSEVLKGILIIDANEEISEEKLAEYEKKFKLYNNGILMYKDKITVKNELQVGEVTQTYSDILSQYNIGNFDKDDFISFFSDSKMLVVYISMFISLFITWFSYYLAILLLENLIPMIFGYLMARLIGVKLRIGNMINITVHAITLPIVLRLLYVIVNTATGFEIKYFEMMCVTIVYIYIITAVILIRSNLIKQQIELMKIVEEQKNVREEIKEQEDKKEEKKEEQDEKKQEDKENKEQKDNNIGKEANGEV